VPQNYDAYPVVGSRTARKEETHTSTRTQPHEATAQSHASAISDEVPVRQYYIADFRNWIRATRTEGHIQVTSKRIIFTAEGRGANGHGTVHQEFAISQIAGIGTTSGFRFSVPHFMIGLMSVFVAAILTSFAVFMGGWAITTLFVSRPPVMEFMRESINQVIHYRILELSQLSLIFGLFAGFGGITLYFILRGKLWFRLMMLGVSFGAFFAVSLTGNTFAYVLFAAAVLVNIYGLVYFACLPDLVVSIYGKGGFIVDIVRGKTCLAVISGRIGAGYPEAAPTAETNSAIYELGAVISDINSHGDAGVAKWSI